MEWKNTDVAINDIRVLFVRYQNIFLINEVRKEDNMSRRFKADFKFTRFSVKNWHRVR